MEYCDHCGKLIPGAQGPGWCNECDDELSLDDTMEDITEEDIQ